jgi:hypothetical protein
MKKKSGSPRAPKARVAAKKSPAASTPVAAAAPIEIPAIGAVFRGGKYAGISLENERRVALVLLAGEIEGTHAEAQAFAKKQDGVLPSRIDQLVLLKNLKREFKARWYWSDEKHAELGEYAWIQHFGDGDQDFLHQSNEYLAVAVRRVPIQ